MADYYGIYRTNYFHVTDEEAYQKLIEGVKEVSDFEDFTKVADDGSVLHGFGGDDTLVYDDGGDDEFYAAIQKLLPDGEAFIMVESGHEKLRYACGGVVVVTNKGIRSGSLASMYSDFCQELGITNYTEPSY